MFDLFWDFDGLFGGRAQVEAEVMGSWPLFSAGFGIRGYVTGMGCRPMGLPMFSVIHIFGHRDDVMIVS
jgi:hypothetical protein